MVHLFFNHNEEKLDELHLLLQTYHLIPHDNQERRSKGLQAILDHLETMTLTPSLSQWIKNDLTEHLDYYGIPLTKEVTNPGPS